jgi:hypothetical protein
MFRTAISTLTAFSVAGMISVFAQQQPPPEQQQKEPAQQAAQTAATLTGCVQEAKTTDGGTAYILNNTQGGTAAMYILTGPPPTELATHLNHKVEVVGQVQQASAPPASEETAAPNPKVLRPPFVQVESVKMVAETCK